MFTQKPGGLSGLQYQTMTVKTGLVCVEVSGRHRVSDITFIHLEDEVFLKGNLCSLKRMVQHAVRGVLGFILGAGSLGVGWLLFQSVRVWTVDLLLVPIDLFKSVPFLGNKLAAIWNRYFFEKHATLVEVSQEIEQNQQNTLLDVSSTLINPLTEEIDPTTEPPLSSEEVYELVDEILYPTEYPESDTATGLLSLQEVGMVEETEQECFTPESSVLPNLTIQTGVGVDESPILMNFNIEFASPTQSEQNIIAEEAFQRELTRNKQWAIQERLEAQQTARTQIENQVFPVHSSTEVPQSEENACSQELPPEPITPPLINCFQEIIFESPDLSAADDSYALKVIDSSRPKTISEKRGNQLNDLVYAIRQKYTASATIQQLLLDEMATITDPEERRYIIAQLLKLFSNQSQVMKIIQEEIQCESPKALDDFVLESSFKEEEEEEEETAEFDRPYIHLLAFFTIESLRLNEANPEANFQFYSPILTTIIRYSDDKYSIFKEELTKQDSENAKVIINELDDLRKVDPVSFDEESNDEETL